MIESIQTKFTKQVIHRFARLLLQGFLLCTYTLFLTTFSHAHASEFPSITLISGEGPFLKNTPNYRIELSTDIAAQCRFSSTANSNPANRPFSQMYYKLSSDDNIKHSVELSAQYNVEQWQLWVKCRDVFTKKELNNAKNKYIKSAKKCKNSSVVNQVKCSFKNLEGNWKNNYFNYALS